MSFWTDSYAEYYTGLLLIPSHHWREIPDIVNKLKLVCTVPFLKVKVEASFMSYSAWVSAKAQSFLAKHIIDADQDIVCD